MPPPPPSATNSFAVASPMPLLPPVINAVLFASLISVSNGCIIKLGCLPRPFGLMLQLHKAVIGLASTRAGSQKSGVKQEYDGAHMVKRTSFEHDDCPVARALDAIGDWWSILIIREALFGVSRFSEFQKKLGLAKNILTVRLAGVVRQGILKTPPPPVG